MRHYTYSAEDLALIRERGRPANRLGFAVHLAYLRFPGRVIGVDERPPADMLAFVSAQIGDDPKAFEEYAHRQQTRRAHLGELQAYLNVRAFRREDYRAVAHVAIEQATGANRGDAIVSTMIEHLRRGRILLPAAVTLEKIALAARALARKRAYKSLAEGLSPETIAKLEAMLAVDDELGRTLLVWLREWPEKPTQKNLSGIIERLQAVRRLGVDPDREKRIHRARYAAIAREIAILVPRDVSRFDTHRRLATLVVFAREMEAILTDAALAMFGKMLGSVNMAPMNAAETSERGPIRAGSLIEEGDLGQPPSMAPESINRGGAGRETSRSRRAHRPKRAGRAKFCGGAVAYRDIAHKFSLA